MNFFYPFVNENGSFELMHSVRLVKKHVPNATIYVVGDNPMLSDVIVLPFPNNRDNRGANVHLKLRHFCEYVGGDFVWMNDDFFINQRFDFNTILHGEQLAVSPKHSAGYQKVIGNTIDLLKKNDLPLISYERHQPVKINSEDALYLMDQLDLTMHMAFKSIYFNVYQPAKSKLSDNLKVGSYSPDRANKMLTMWGCFSSSDEFAKKGHEFIRELK
jgi:hypothetical protein